MRNVTTLKSLGLLKLKSPCWESAGQASMDRSQDVFAESKAAQVQEDGFALESEGRPFGHAGKNQEPNSNPRPKSETVNAVRKAVV